jgi:uncharacterized protein YcbK (DUF882 family)
MKLEENFHIDEFKCRDGSSVPEEHIENIKELAKNLQVLRDYIDKPIVVISGYRSLQYNTSIGSKPTSQHVKSKAADIIVSGMTPLEVRNTIIKLIKEGKMKKGGVGVYSSFTHYDTRGYNARWGSYKK